VARVAGRAKESGLEVSHSEMPGTKQIVDQPAEQAGTPRAGREIEQRASAW
jgi:hypothetical protein